MHKELTKEMVDSKYTYDLITGIFYHINPSANNKVKAGDVAGSLRDGYSMLYINNRLYSAHRVVWLITYGYLPHKHLDHINHIRNDNRIQNLREVGNCSDNQRNGSKNRNNTSGKTGVYLSSSGKYVARIMVDNKSIYLGSFNTLEDAVKARSDAEVTYGFHKNHGK